MTTTSDNTLLNIADSDVDRILRALRNHAQATRKCLFIGHPTKATRKALADEIRATRRITQQLVAQQAGVR